MFDCEERCAREAKVLDEDVEGKREGNPVWSSCKINGSSGRVEGWAGVRRGNWAEVRCGDCQWSTLLGACTKLTVKIGPSVAMTNIFVALRDVPTAGRKREVESLQALAGLQAVSTRARLLARRARLLDILVRTPQVRKKIKYRARTLPTGFEDSIAVSARKESIIINVPLALRLSLFEEELVPMPAGGEDVVGPVVHRNVPSSVTSTALAASRSRKFSICLGALWSVCAAAGSALPPSLEYSVTVPAKQRQHWKREWSV
ncbi:hypothetical protein K438DRAFT_1784413 [Mycena galopus ATCC 62051]|nr:hypothetical protein K438DRAFT_1784413 [Mycena galopus ATCC 62051]